MSDVLTAIVDATRRRLAAQPPRSRLADAESMVTRREPHRFRQALTQHRRSSRVIAEIKAASPSAGTIVTHPPVEEIARAYRRGGAAAVSVVTEPDFFRGEAAWIRRAAEATGLPVLMKDFVIDSRQIIDGMNAGADAVLLLASLLSARELRTMIGLLDEHGCDAVVEVHDEDELERALNAGTAIVGVNSRNLRDFTVDLGAAERLAGQIPADVVRVAESGIRSPEDAARMKRAGFDAILVGEHLLRQANRETAVRSLAGPPVVKICGITRREDAFAAVEAGADFIGFVFAPGSPRQIDVARAAAIADDLRKTDAGVRSVGIFRNQDAATIESIFRDVRLDLVQIYGVATPRTVPIIRAIPVNGGPPDVPASTDAAWLLFDGATPGSGHPFEWSHLDGLQTRQPFFLAGGLEPASVRAAVARVRPEGVDVSSGVEEAIGIKSAAKIRTFIEEVKRA